MLRNFGAFALTLPLVLACHAPALAAHYQGRNVDDRRYRGTVSNNDYGVYHNVEIKFQSDRAYVYFPAGGRLILTLEDEEIVDPPLHSRARLQARDSMGDRSQGPARSLSGGPPRRAGPVRRPPTRGPSVRFVLVRSNRD